MGLFSHKKQRPSESVCQHENVDPRWNAMEDAGISERIDHYVCRRCETRIEKRPPGSGD